MRVFRKSIVELSDRELLEQYKNSRDLIYVGELFKRYSALIFGVALKYLKNEEESHDATMEIYEVIQTTSLEKDIIHFRSWLYSVTRNHCLMRLRTIRQSQIVYQAPETLINSNLVMEDDSVILVTPAGDSIREADVEDAITGLCKEQAACLHLFFYEGKKYREITSLTGYSLNEVKSYIQNGKRNLRNILSKKE